MRATTEGCNSTSSLRMLACQATHTKTDAIASTITEVTTVRIAKESRNPRSHHPILWHIFANLQAWQACLDFEQMGSTREVAARAFGKCRPGRMNHVRPAGRRRLLRKRGMTIAHDPRCLGKPGTVPQVPRGAGRAASRSEVARQARCLGPGPADDVAGLFGAGGGAHARPEVLATWLRPMALREVVVLKYCQGWPLSWIAERTGRTGPAVASLLRRGLEELRNRLG